MHCWSLSSYGWCCLSGARGDEGEIILLASALIRLVLPFGGGGARSKEQGARSKEHGARSKGQGARSKEQNGHQWSLPW